MTEPLRNLPPLPGLPYKKAKLVRPQRCGNCKHKGDEVQRDKHECRESPPTASVFMVQQGGGQGFVTHTGFPLVGVDCWCGKWATKIEQVN